MLSNVEEISNNVVECLKMLFKMLTQMLWNVCKMLDNVIKCLAKCCKMLEIGYPKCCEMWTENVMECEQKSFKMS